MIGGMRLFLDLVRDDVHGLQHPYVLRALRARERAMPKGGGTRHRSDAAAATRALRKRHRKTAGGVPMRRWAKLLAIDGDAQANDWLKRKGIRPRMGDPAVHVAVAVGLGAGGVHDLVDVTR